MTAVEKRIELRGEGLDVRTTTDPEEGFLVISLRVEAADELGFVSLSGSASEIRSILARSLAVVNAVERAGAALEPDAD